MPNNWTKSIDLVGGYQELSRGLRDFKAKMNYYRSDPKLSFYTIG